LPKNCQKTWKNGCFWQFLKISSKKVYNSGSNWDI
jgi:hypothetical protein